MITLAGVPFFGPLIQNRIPYGVDDEGYIFIDRDGSMFEIIIQWLRNKQRPDEQVLKTNRTTLLQECDFYGLDDLSDVICGRTCSLDLRCCDRKIRDNEECAKKDPNSYAHMLIDVHNIAIEQMSRETLEIPLLFADVPRSNVKDGFNEFYERLNKFSGNMLTDLGHIPGLIFAGGSVLGALTESVSGDVDIFLKLKVEEAENTLIQIYEAIRINQQRTSKKRLLVTRSKHAVTFYRAGPNNSLLPPVQV